MDWSAATACRECCRRQRFAACMDEGGPWAAEGFQARGRSARKPRPLNAGGPLCSAGQPLEPLSAFQTCQHVAMDRIWPNLPNDEGLGFAFDSEALVSRQSVAAELAGHTLSRVTYVLLEYDYEQHGDHVGFRAVTDSAELADPAWRFNGFHNVDYGIHFVLDDGAQFFATWDNPGWIEALDLLGDHFRNGQGPRGMSPV